MLSGNPKDVLRFTMDGLWEAIILHYCCFSLIPRPYQPQHGSLSVLCKGKECLVIFDKHRAPVSPPTTEWLITTLIHTECLVIFDMFSCLDGMSNYDISRATKQTP